MKTIKTEIEIEASPSRVWDVLTDLESYSGWNPFIVSASGNVAEGSSLELEMASGETRTMTLTPTVTKAEASTTFEWLGSVGFKGIFDGRHRFTLSEADGGTRLDHSEQFTGILAPLMHALIGRQTLASFESMNQALKSKVESGA